MKKLATTKGFLVMMAIMFLGFTANAQDIVQDDEVLRINTSVGQISLAIEQTTPEPFKVEVFDNGVQMQNVKLESPSNGHPLQVIILVALQPVEKWKTNNDELAYQIKKLAENPNINLTGINVVNDQDGFCNKLKFPKSISSARFDNLNVAIGESITRLDQTKGNRKAILLLTNEVESLPVDVIVRTNELLGQSSLMVYLMSVNEKGLMAYRKNSKLKQKIIARTNINGQDLIIFPNNFLAGLFRSFTRLATNLHTVSYDLEETENHKVEAVVTRLSDNRAIAKNIREFKALPAMNTENVSKVSFRKSGNDEETAVKEIINQSFDQLLNLRAPKLSSEEVKKYEVELLRRPELKDVEIVPESDPAMVNLNKNLTPLMKLYERDDYTKTFVYKSDNPFIGLYRECIVIISTKSLELLTEQQIRAAVAHELAHEIFIDEMRSADKDNNNEKRHLIEYKCDIVAVMATTQLKDDPYAVAKAGALFNKWYLTNRPEVDESSHPSPALREKCIRMYLETLNEKLKSNIN